MIDYRENLQKCHEYVKALEDERRKIEMFQRELPLCLELVTQAIETCKQQLSGTAAATTTTTTDCLNGLSECSEQTTSDGPVFEEFMPIKRGCDSEHGEGDGDEEHESYDNTSQFGNKKEKPDWLRSVQLWNQSPDPATTNTSNEDVVKVGVVDLKRNNGGAFHPFKKELKGSGDGAVATCNNKSRTTVVAQVSATSVCSTEERAGAAGGCGTSKKAETDKDGPKKARRCWSQELHRRFLSALNQLGGPQVATPKQIRELMKVDGLTNDEVKSHLQKYRLHNRRPTTAVHSNANTQAPQFVVVGGIWVPPQDYAAVAASGATFGDAKSSLTAAHTGVYAPVASAPSPAVGLPHHQASAQREQRKQSSHSEGARCNSPATSSSTHTTTASPAY